MTRSPSPLSPELHQSVSYIKRKVRQRPTLAIVLGSGLGDFANRLGDKVVLPAAEIPNYPTPSVSGHGGNLIFGRIGSTRVLAFQGRVHFYEVGDLNRMLCPVHVAANLGIRKLLVTNAAGGINRHFRPGDLMLITDQINLTFLNPLLPISVSKQFKNGWRRNVSSYNTELQKMIEETAREKHIQLRRGIYCGVLGPSYETAAEVEMVRRIGGDAVGMSTVNEVSLAHALGIKVAGISCITNFATGIGTSPLSHDEVTEVADRVNERFANLVSAIVEKLG